LSLELLTVKKNQKMQKKKAEKERKKLFNNYTLDGKKNWNKNKSYFKESYISTDMVICSKLIEEK
jgi:hypothetical protein